MSSSLPFFLNPPIHPNKSQSLSTPSISLSSHFLTFKSHICFATDPSQFDRQEAFWLREEQRWLREEQRWIREEKRWERERQSLLQRISDLEFQIQALERQKEVRGGAEVSETIATISRMLQVLKEKSLIAESGSSSSPIVFEEKKGVEEEVVAERVLRVLDGESEKVEMKRKPLRVGSEGAEVRALQEALQKLGFYSGEEDIEFSSFSSGTERAVKTWQSSVGAPEDGIMTEKLLEILYTEQNIEGGGSSLNAENLTVKSKDGANGAAVSSVTSNIQQKVVKEEGETEVEESHHRVFLLGENRWEEPSRLIGSKKKPAESKTKETTTKCLTCRGEGRLMCTECDGTGEPNIEPQFLEWVDEGAKCPYCEGLGYTICDVCEGKTVVLV
ncbi:hypothetical protein UlMin_010272 [Ulmus minor]